MRGQMSLRRAYGRLRDSWRDAGAIVATLLPCPRALMPVRGASDFLVRDEIRQEVGENSEQRQAANAVDGEHPGSTAFVFDRRGCSVGLLVRRDDRGPIFHARTSRRKDRGAQCWYASRPPRIAAGQDLTAILPRFHAVGGIKCDQTHRINMKNIFPVRKLFPWPVKPLTTKDTK